MENHRILRSLLLLCALVAPATAMSLSGPGMSVWDPPSRHIATMAKAAPQLEPTGLKLEPKQVSPRGVDLSGCGGLSSPRLPSTPVPFPACAEHAALPPSNLPGHDDARPGEGAIFRP